jgi:WhiB family transcriptional regulator, redox-sensing transcriptional regulator
MSFDSVRHQRDWLALHRAIDNAPLAVPCTNLPEAYYISDMADLHLQNLAKAACKTCPVRDECLSYALKWEEYGVWGGLSPNERRKIRFKVA